MELINSCIKTAGILKKQLHAVAISGGPGSYTGLRIGCSSAKGICYALNIPLIVIDTLKIIAFSAREKYVDTNYFWAMIDARRMEVYHAVFNLDLSQATTTTNGIITDENFIPGIAKTDSVILCGDGAAKAAPVLSLRDADVMANARGMCILAKESYLNSEFADVAYYEPFYLKQANITVSK